MEYGYPAISSGELLNVLHSRQARTANVSKTQYWSERDRGIINIQIVTKVSNQSLAFLMSFSESPEHSKTSFAAHSRPASVGASIIVYTRRRAEFCVEVLQLLRELSRISCSRFKQA